MNGLFAIIQRRLTSSFDHVELQTDAKKPPKVVDHLSSPSIGTVEKDPDEKMAGRHVIEQGRAVLEELSCAPQVTSLRLLRLTYHSQPNIFALSLD
jgi:hypothetical protein